MLDYCAIKFSFLFISLTSASHCLSMTAEGKSGSFQPSLTNSIEMHMHFELFTYGKKFQNLFLSLTSHLCGCSWFVVKVRRLSNNTGLYGVWVSTFSKGQIQQISWDVTLSIKATALSINAVFSTTNYTHESSLEYPFHLLVEKDIQALRKYVWKQGAFGCNFRWQSYFFN